MKKKIGILYICTGKYTCFWNGFYQSAEKYLLPELEKHYFVFTDGKINTYGNPFVKVVEQECLGWPFDTLYRFKMFLKIENHLQKMDYLYFFNSNLVIMQNIGNEILPDEENELVVTQHPGFFDKKRSEFTYDTNKNSSAYIAENEGCIYVAGGLNGATTQNFLKLAKILSQNIDTDYEKGIIALWHDESHINRYIIGKNVKVLSPSYLFPQDWNIPFEQKILILDKNKFGGHDFLRQIPQKMDFINQEIWDKSYQKYDLDLELPASNPINEWIKIISSLKENGKSIEIGVFPGIYTKIFGKLGYEISGVDLTPRVTELNTYFETKNFKVGKFVRENFFEYKSSEKYDVVFSIGFIEHFKDYKTVIKKHCDLVNDGGVLLIIVPNFRGKLQYILHKLIDNENLKRHNVKSMNPKDWEQTIINQDFEIIMQGYIGGFHFWTEEQKRNFIQRKIARMLRKHDLFLGKVLFKPSASYSPYCGIIARKRG